jgi:hypothetical protein
MGDSRERPASIKGTERIKVKNRTALYRAAHYLRDKSGELWAGYRVGKKWSKSVEGTEAREAHDAMLAVAEKLERMRRRWR